MINRESSGSWMALLCVEVHIDTYTWTHMYTQTHVCETCICVTMWMHTCLPIYKFTQMHPHTFTYWHTHNSTHTCVRTRMLHLWLALAPYYTSPHSGGLSIFILIFLVISGVPRLYLNLKLQMSIPLWQLWLAFTVDSIKAELTLPVYALRFQTLRGFHWRGRDCNDSNKMAYPGRR